VSHISVQRFQVKELKEIGALEDSGGIGMQFSQRC
jgi:hypothetical protein